MAQGLCFCTAVVAGQEIERSSWRDVFLVAVAFSVWALAAGESLAASAEHIQFFLLIDQILRRTLSISLFLLLCAIPCLMDPRTASPAVTSAFAENILCGEDFIVKTVACLREI